MLLALSNLEPHSSNLNAALLTESNTALITLADPPLVLLSEQYACVVPCMLQYRKRAGAGVLPSRMLDLTQCGTMCTSEKGILAEAYLRA